MANSNDIIYSPTLSNNPTLARTFTKSDGTLADTEIAKIMASRGLFDSTASYNEEAWRSRFARIPYLDPYNTMGVTHEYLFFTKPDLHLLNQSTGKVAESLSSYTFFTDTYDRYPHIFEQLQSSAKSKYPCPFMNILSNTVRSQLDIPSLESENDIETGANVYGTKITYRGSSYTSDQDLSFSLEFEDNKFLEVFMLFKTYDEYCRLKNMGMIELDPKRADDAHWVNYTIDKVLHDQFSVYKFVTADDGMSLIYWGKYTGVFPTGAPRDAFSSMDGGPQRLTVPFKAQFFRDMDAVTLSEFNKIGINSSSKYRTSDLPLFDTKRNIINGTWARMPYIYVSPNADRKGMKNKMMKYQLRWKS